MPKPARPPKTPPPASPAPIPARLPQRMVPPVVASLFDLDIEEAEGEEVTLAASMRAFASMTDEMIEGTWCGRARDLRAEIVASIGALAARYGAAAPVRDIAAAAAAARRERPLVEMLANLAMVELAHKQGLGGGVEFLAAEADARKDQVREVIEAIARYIRCRPAPEA